MAPEAQTTARSAEEEGGNAAPERAAIRQHQTGGPWSERIQSQTSGGVTVSTAVLTARESWDELGVWLAGARIQPTWVQVENREEIRYYIPPIIIDQDYFSADEAAWAAHHRFSPRANARIDRTLRARCLPSFVEPGATVSGFVFTNLDEGVKYINVELIGARQQRARRFAFMARIPGLQVDFLKLQGIRLYGPEEIRELDEPGLRDWLESLPACTKGGDRTCDADPLNVVMIGTSDAIFPALARRGWHVTETTRLSSAWHTILSSLLRRVYRYAPVSPLYVFDRPQDIALQKPRGNVNQRNHMRLWIAPVSVGGARVWVGQISRDIGVRLTWKTITTHKIDPDVDETRWYLMQDLFFSQGLRRFAFVKGVGAATPEAPKHNYTGDPYFTDGLRLVLWMSEEPITYQHVEGMAWETPSPR